MRLLSFSSLGSCVCLHYVASTIASTDRNATLASEACHVKHRNHHRENDHRNGQTHDDNNDGTQKTGHGVHLVFDLEIVGVGHLAKHIFEFAGFFADIDHVNHNGWK